MSNEPNIKFAAGVKPAHRGQITQMLLRVFNGHDELSRVYVTPSRVEYHWADTSSTVRYYKSGFVQFVQAQTINQWSNGPMYCLPDSATGV